MRIRIDRGLRTETPFADSIRDPEAVIHRDLNIPVPVACGIGDSVNLVEIERFTLNREQWKTRRIA